MPAPQQPERLAIRRTQEHPWARWRIARVWQWTANFQSFWNSDSGRLCSGLMNPDTNLGGNIAAVNEVFNEKTASIFLDRI